MKRYYYTDPLAAAYMAKHFGMKLLADNDEGGLVDAGARFIDCDDTLRELWQHDFSYLGKLYINPDSLNLIEPRSGDKVSYSFGAGQHAGEVWDEVKEIITADDERYPYTGNGEPYVLTDGIDEFPLSRLKEIFQRNGIAFIWPESEEV